MSDPTPGPAIRATKRLVILLVKPKAHLGTVHALHRFQILEPIELGYIAAAVPPEHRVEVLDLRFYRRPAAALLRRIKDLAPDIIGFTGY
jgi:hypothetical protein